MYASFDSASGKLIFGQLKNPDPKIGQFQNLKLSFHKSVHNICHNTAAARFTPNLKNQRLGSSPSLFSICYYSPLPAGCKPACANPRHAAPESRLLPPYAALTDHRAQPAPPALWSRWRKRPFPSPTPSQPPLLQLNRPKRQAARQNTKKQLRQRERIYMEETLQSRQINNQ